MIRKIKFKNFYSFKEEQTVDFTASKKKSENYFQTFDGKQISKIAAFAGPNNSGKTNVMKVFGFVDYFLSVPARGLSSGEQVGFKSYTFGKEEPSSFYVEFETQNKLYFYTLEATAAKVLAEKLEAKKLVKNARKYKIFSRKGTDVMVNKNVVSGITQKALGSIREDVSVVAFLKANYDVDEINEVSHYFALFRTNVNEAGVVRSAEENMGFVAAAYKKFPELKEKMEEFVRNFDLGIEGFNIQEAKDGEITVDALHKVGDKTYKLPIGYESRGTKSLFVELLNIIISIEEGTVLVLDEIETGLHPEAVEKLVQFVVDNFADQKKQFIFTSHSLGYMRKYDPQQMYLVEKENNTSSLFRLDELNVRPDENFFAKYMSGSYGAFPRIRV